MLFLLKQFSLVVEHGKNEVFHFSKLHGTFDPPSLDLSQISSLILKLKDS